jgi:hypothetical protein
MSALLWSTTLWHVSAPTELSLVVLLLLLLLLQWPLL